MIQRSHLCRRAFAASSSPRPCQTRRCLSSTILDSLSRPVQSYVSTSRDPYVNLAIEHYLLQKTAPESAILFLYTNRPSVIIGRNQNPWLEVNLALLNTPCHHLHTERSGLGNVDLVRRRSGGGTVFHDEGNVNWSVICSSADFTRDKHAEMVVRALRSCGIDRARVNARHDIVLDQGRRGRNVNPHDTHSTMYEATDFDTPTPLKVSGSAYKLTRNRALHHGTCLLSSPNLNAIPNYLHSPAKPFITARGVESVSSPVGNILVSNEDFSSAVHKEFFEQYTESRSRKSLQVDEEWLEEPTIKRGYDELKSYEWTYLQTPQFTIATQPQTIPGIDFELTVRYGAVKDGTLKGHTVSGEQEKRLRFDETLQGQKIHEISSWKERLLAAGINGLRDCSSQRLIDWLEKMLPRVP